MQFFLFIVPLLLSLFIIYDRIAETFLLTEPCTHDEFSIEFPQVKTVISDNDDLPVKFPSKASFTKNESFIDGESTKGQTTRDDSSCVVKKGSPCLHTEEESEFSELPRHQRITPELLVISCEDPGKANSISTSEINMAKPKGAVPLPNSNLFSYLALNALLFLSIIVILSNFHQRHDPIAFLNGQYC